MNERVPRVRRFAIPQGATLVVRGDALDVNVLRADAARFRRRFPDWDRFGVSAFLALDDAEVDVLCESRLVQFPTVVVFDRASLEENGLEVVPTFRTPHVTLAHAELEELVNRLSRSSYIERTNPYYEAEDV